MAIIVDRFDGGENTSIPAIDLPDNVAQTLYNFTPKRIGKLVAPNAAFPRTNNLTDALPIPGQGFHQYRAEYTEDGEHASTLFRVGSRFINSAGGQEINIHRYNTKSDFEFNLPLEPWSSAFIGPAASLGGWERGASNRLVNGSSNISFTSSGGVNRIAGDANLENYEIGEILAISGTSDNDTYYTVVAKAPVANTTEVLETVAVEANTSAQIYPLPAINMYALAGVLRLSNGNFYDSHESQWYGFVKRDFWGQGVTYGVNGGRYLQPTMKQAQSDWYRAAQELTAPTVILGARTGAATSAENEVAIHIAGVHPTDWPERSELVDWNKSDRVTCTFTYDFVQESELGKTASGEIGLELGTPVSIDDARAFMVEVYTGANNASFNKRITSVNLYYKFHDDPDWYQVMVLNVNTGWKDSEVIFNVENTGYWTPIIASVSGSGTTDGSGGSDVTVNDAAHPVSDGEQMYFLNITTIEPGSLQSVLASGQGTGSMTLPVAMVDSLGENPADYNSLDYIYGVVSTVAVSTFYIPFSGEKAFSYFTNTSRAAALKVPATRWKASDTNGSEVLIGNIDSKDDNDQTLRERSRVIETPAGMPDTFLLTHSRDVGTGLGDAVTDIKYYNGNWWVFMARNIAVLRPKSLQEVGRVHGRGSAWAHSTVITPHGICAADTTKISIYPSGEDLSEAIQREYQELDFFEATLGYDMALDELQFMPNTSIVGVGPLNVNEMRTYSFRTKSWRTHPVSGNNVTYSNIVSNAKNNTSEVMRFVDSVFNGVALQIEVGTEDDAGLFNTGFPSRWKSKAFHNGTPYNDKTWGKAYLDYKYNGAVAVNIYLNQSDVIYKTINLSPALNWKSALIEVNAQSRIIEFEVIQGDAAGAPILPIQLRSLVMFDEEINVIQR